MNTFFCPIVQFYKRVFIIISFFWLKNLFSMAHNLERSGTLFNLYTCIGSLFIPHCPYYFFTFAIWTSSYKLTFIYTATSFALSENSHFFPIYLLTQFHLLSYLTIRNEISKLSLHRNWFIYKHISITSGALNYDSVRIVICHQLMIPN